MNLSFLVIVARNYHLLRSVSLVGEVKRGKREKERESRIGKRGRKKGEGRREVKKTGGGRGLEKEVMR